MLVSIRRGSLPMPAILLLRLALWAMSLVLGGVGAFFCDHQLLDAELGRPCFGPSVRGTRHQLFSRPLKLGGLACGSRAGHPPRAGGGWKLKTPVTRCCGGSARNSCCAAHGRAAPPYACPRRKAPRR